LLSYASLLESTDTEKAVTMYRRALDADPSQVTAWFNLGALYVNQASGISVQMQTENDDARYKVLSDQMLAYLQEALPLLTRAHQLQPNDIATLQALKQIAISLELPDLYQEYKQKLDALEGQ
ncbi:MAG: tetratricopeptide repeat protein, partial [Chromatiales bacterium]|nr:tetratricopeptide repeat protein [Chromatiales bacterium]